MRNLAKHFRTLAVMIGLASAGLATGAQAQTTVCGVTGSASAAPAVYDPFNPTGLASTSITLNLTRINNSGGGDTRLVNFYLRANTQTGSGANGTIIVPTSVTGSAAIEGIGNNIFYNFGTPGPTMLQGSNILTPPAGSPSFMQIDFTGNNSGSNTAQVTFNVTLPPNLNLTAIQNLAFDVIYACDIRGGQANGNVYTGLIPDAVKFPVTVLSALRTYYAGTALDFGEIGAIPAVPLGPVRTNPGNYVFVQSSGAYQVQLSSQNGFKLKKPGAATINDEVRYSLKFLGDTRDSTTTPVPGATAIDHTCIRAGMATAGQQLPIQATLVDGGQNKNPSPTYTDFLTVTITPLAYNIGGVDNCGGFTVP